MVLDGAKLHCSEDPVIARQVHLDDALDLRRTIAHHEDTIGEIDCLAEEMGDRHDRACIATPNGFLIRSHSSRLVVRGVGHGNRLGCERGDARLINPCV